MVNSGFDKMEAKESTMKMEMGNVNDERGLGAKSLFLFIIFSPPN